MLTLNGLKAEEGSLLSDGARSDLILQLGSRLLWIIYLVNNLVGREGLASMYVVHCKGVALGTLGASKVVLLWPRCDVLIAARPALELAHF